MRKIIIFLLCLVFLVILTSMSRLNSYSETTLISSIEEKELHEKTLTPLNLENEKDDNELSLEYLYNTQKIIEEYFPDSRLDAETIYQSANIVYKETGIIVPSELTLSIAKMETNLGRTGVGRSDNLFGIYNRKFDDVDESCLHFNRLMAKRYLKCKSIEELIVDFRNCNGQRYAENSHYEKQLVRLYNKISN